MYFFQIKCSAYFEAEYQPEEGSQPETSPIYIFQKCCLRSELLQHFASYFEAFGLRLIMHSQHNHRLSLEYAWLKDSLWFHEGALQLQSKVQSSATQFYYLHVRTMLLVTLSYSVQSTD